MKREIDGLTVMAKLTQSQNVSSDRLDDRAAGLLNSVDESVVSSRVSLHSPNLAAVFHEGC